MKFSPFPAILYAVPVGLLLLAFANLYWNKDTDSTTLAVPFEMASANIPPSPLLPQIDQLADQTFFEMRRAPGQSRISTQLKPGGTLAVVLDDAGISRGEAARAIAALRKVFKPRNLRAGQAIELILEPDTAENATAGSQHLAGFSTRINSERTVVLNRQLDGDFVARELVRETELQMVRVKGNINSSLYLSALAAGASDAAVIEFSRLYTYSVDFQRGIRSGDGFDMIFERYVDKKGNTVKTGNLLYARLMPRNRDLKLYRFQTPDGEIGFYNEKGESARRFLMKTPIDGARISSGFGKRRHPVLGYTRAHKGTDFAAGTGTPILAAGNGIIERASRFGSYGNYIRIRHANGFKTAYAHLSKFGRGIKKGRRVQQGQIIGYVGATGRVTGAHLHYEVIKNGRQVNPMTVKLPSGRKLKSAELPDFARNVKQIDQLVEHMLPVHSEPAQIVANTTDQET